LNNSSTVKFERNNKAEFSVSALPWEAGRVGKAASALCAADPLVMEPDQNGLQGDIEYLYRLYLTNPSGMGHLGERVRWDVEILQPTEGVNFWDNPTEKNMTVTIARMPLHEFTKQLINKWGAK
jgi:hypothetical protein